MLRSLARKRLFAHVAASSDRLYGLPKFESFCFRFLSSAASASPRNASLGHEEHTFTLSYLMNSCGLDPESANVAAKKVTLNSPKKPDLVLKLLRKHGFTDDRITKLVTIHPKVLLANPVRTLSPKLEFFLSIGMSPSIVSEVVTLSPVILHYSLKRRLIPFHNYLKELLHSDEKVVNVYRRAGYCITYSMDLIPPNVSILRKCGVSDSNISFILTHYPRSLSMGTERLVEFIEKVVGLGIDASKLMFFVAIHVLHNTSKLKWERLKQIYGSWGWSESDILKAFTIHSSCMSLSEKKITSTMEFLVNEMNYDPRPVVSCPTLLFYSLEKRIVPRCRVVQVLMARGHIKRSCRILSLASMADQMFKDKFISKYQEEIPQLLDVYCGKLSPLDLGLSSSELAEVKLL